MLRSLGFILGAVGSHGEFGTEKTEVLRGADSTHTVQLRIPDGSSVLCPLYYTASSPGCPASPPLCSLWKRRTLRKDLGGWGCLLDQDSN